jgi:hypothetical protein
MHLPKPIYNAVPAIYFVMGIATMFFVTEAVLLEKSIGIATSLYISSLLLFACSVRIKHLRRVNKATNRQLIAS